jgi:hypothetical protein
MDEFDLIADALGAVRMIQGVYGTGHDGATRIDEVAQMLRLRALQLSGEGEARAPQWLRDKRLSGEGEAGPPQSAALAVAVADAIRKTYGTEP